MERGRRPRSIISEVFQKFSWAFVWKDPVNVLAKFEIRSILRSSDNRGYPEKLGSPWICPHSLFPKKFNGHFVRMDTVNVLAKLEVRSLTQS